MYNAIKVNIDEEIKRFYQRVSGEMFSSARGIEEIHSAVLETSKSIGIILGVPLEYWGVEDIDMKSREALLYTVPGYRDHFVHQFNVFLTGYKIIDLLGTESIDVLDSEETNHFCNIYRIWFLCSLFHDIVYTIEKMDEWLPTSLQRFLGVGKDEEEKWSSVYNHNVLNWDKFYMLNKDHFAEMKDYYVCSNVDTGKKISFQSLSGLFDEGILGNKKNHGTMSALWLLRQNAPKETVDDDLLAGTEKKARVIAATAIALHTSDTLKSIHPKIIFDKFPIPFLLMLCDNLCEWGRLKPIERKINTINSNKHDAIKYVSKGPKLKDLKYDEEDKVLTCQLEYFLKERNERDSTRAQENITNAILEFVKPFTNRFLGGDYKFVIEYFLDNEIIEDATIVFHEQSSK